MTTDVLPVTDRTRISRLRERQVLDRAAMRAVLDAGLVAHVAAVMGGTPVVLPMAYARDGDRLLLHGSTGAGLLRAAAAGAPVCVAVTLLDGLVYARSMFESSMNYRSVVVVGVPRVLDGEERLAGLRALSEHLMPGRWAEVPPPTARDLAATLVLELALDEVSVKIRDGGPSDGAEDGAGIWAGVLPLAVGSGEPVTADDVPAGVGVPASVAAARARLG
jgi:nitroimidazol reductase NimA-like FMN-containing flavoprotein (pyridoxamine 5'-phosphate oxidase superfamily)